MKQIFLTILVLILMVVNAGAEIITQTIRGTVMDIQTRNPLSGANIVLTVSDQIIGTTTNEQGNFRIGNVEIGRVSLRATFMGYQDVVMQNINLQAGKELILNIYMNELIMALGEVKITHTVDKTTPINQMAIGSARVFTVEETERYAGSRNDPARMAANFAGVVGIDDSRNDIIIRGNSPLGLLWRLEGVNIHNPNHWGNLGSTGGPVSMLNNTLLANSTFYTGAFPAEFGNALSGVFDLRMRSGNNERYEFLGQIGFNGFELGAEGPIMRNKGSSFLVNYRYSTMGVFSALGIDFGTVGIPYYQDLSFKLNFPNTSLGHISVFGLGGLSDIEIWDSKKNPDDINFYGGEGIDITTGTDMGVIGLSSHYFFNTNTSAKVTLAAKGQRTYTQVDTLSLSLERFRFFESALDDNRFSASAILNHRFNPKHSLRGGVSAKMMLSDLYDRVWRKDFDEYRSQIDFEGTTWLISSHLQWNYRPSNQFTLNMGLHYNHFTFNNSSSLEPRIGLRYRIAPMHTISFGYGLHSQISPLFVYFFQKANADGTYTQTNHNLGLTKSHHFVAGYDFKINPFTRIKLEAYYQSIFDAPVDAIESNSFSMLNNGASFVFQTPEFLVNDGIGTNYGVELTVERFLNKGYYFLVTGSLFESKFTGSNGKVFNSAFNNNYVLNVLVGKEFSIGRHNPGVKRSISIDLKTTIAGGKRTTPWVAVFNSQTREFAQSWNYNRAFDIQLPNYNKTDLRITYRSNRRRMTQEWGVEITNLFNNKNILSETFNTRTGEGKFVNQLPFMIIPQYRILF